MKSYLRCIMSLGLTIVLLLAGCTAQTSAMSTPEDENDAVLDNSNDTSQQILMETEESIGESYDTTTHYIYDEEGKLTASYSFYDSGSFEYYVTYEYDSQDRLLKTVIYDDEQYDVSTGTLRLGDVHGYETYSYNSDGTYTTRSYWHYGNYGAYYLSETYTWDENGNELEGMETSLGNSQQTPDLYDIEENLIQEGDSTLEPEYSTYDNTYNDDGTLAEQIWVHSYYNTINGTDVINYSGKRYTYNADGTVKVEETSADSKEDIAYTGTYDIFYYDEYGNETVDEHYSASGSLYDTIRHTYTYATLENLLANNSLTVEGL